MSTVKTLNVKEIYVSKNHRDTGRSENLADLMASISGVGLINPITVRESDKGYEVVAGHRRFAAIQKLGWENVEAHIMPLSQNERDIANHAENFHRKNPTAWEEGMIYAEDYTSGRLSLEEISVKYRVDVDRVKKCMLIFNELPEEFKGSIVFAERKKIPGTISVSAAQQILNLSKRVNIGKSGIKQMLSVAKQKEMTMPELRATALQLKAGKSVEEAVEAASKIQSVRIEFLITKSKIKKLEEETGEPFPETVMRHLEEKFGAKKAGAYKFLTQKKADL